MKWPFKKGGRFYLKSPAEGMPVPIAGDAALATAGIVDGKLVPLLILDATNRPDLAEAIRVHQDFAAGDVVVQWGAMPDSQDKVALFLRFLRPIELNAIIEFDIVKQGIVVEHILMAGAMYIQAGKPGDRLVHNPNLPKMIVQIAETGYRPYWDKLFLKAITRDLRAHGHSRADAKRVAQNYIRELRNMSDFRMLDRRTRVAPKPS